MTRLPYNCGKKAKYKFLPQFQIINIIETRLPYNCGKKAKYKFLPQFEIIIIIATRLSYNYGKKAKDKFGCEGVGEGEVNGGGEGQPTGC